MIFTANELERIELEERNQQQVIASQEGDEVVKQEEEKEPNEETGSPKDNVRRIYRSLIQIATVSS